MPEYNEAEVNAENIQNYLSYGDSDNLPTKTSPTYMIPSVDYEFHVSCERLRYGDNINSMGCKIEHEEYEFTLFI